MLVGVSVTLCSTCNRWWHGTVFVLPNKRTSLIYRYTAAQVKTNLWVNFYSHLSGMLIHLYYRACFTTLVLRLWAWEAAADVVPTERSREACVSIFLRQIYRPAGLDSRGAHIWWDTSYLHDSPFFSQISLFLVKDTEDLSSQTGLPVFLCH